MQYILSRVLKVGLFEKFRFEEDLKLSELFWEEYFHPAETKLEAMEANVTEAKAASRQEKVQRSEGGSGNLAMQKLVARCKESDLCEMRSHWSSVQRSNMTGLLTNCVSLAALLRMSGNRVEMGQKQGQETSAEIQVK